MSERTLECGSRALGPLEPNTLYLLFRETRGDEYEVTLFNRRFAHLVHVDADDAMRDLAPLYERFDLFCRRIAELEYLFAMGLTLALVTWCDEYDGSATSYEVSCGIECLVRLPELDIEGIAVGNHYVVLAGEANRTVVGRPPAALSMCFL